MMVESALGDAELVHIGLVCRNMAEAKQQLRNTLGVDWVGGETEQWQLVVDGVARTLAMRIAHTPTGSPRYELIEAVAGTPWHSEAEVRLHHLCYYSADGVGLCQKLEAQGYRRVLGCPGDAAGYFQAPEGLLIEVVDDGLKTYLDGFRMG